MSHTEEKLREVLTAIVEEKYPQGSQVKIKPTSSDGANYSSAIYQATIIAPKENVEVFAKVCNMGDTFDEEGKCIFETEKYVYSNLASAFEKIQDKHGLTDKRFVFPKYFKSSATDGFQIVILENLAIKGYGCYDRFKCIDWEYASKCIETLARYHALSFALSKEDPEEFKKAGETLKLPELKGTGWETLTDGALAAVDKEDREKLSQFLEGSVGWNKMKDFGDPLKTPVIIHGDYRASNLLHNEVNGDIHVIPVDYQTARLGCPAADLLYFILMGSDQQFRQKHFHHLIDFYYEQLSQAMRRLDLVPEEMYGREEFDSDFKEKIPLGICVAAMVLPFVTVDPAQAPVFKEKEFVPPPNELFAERFRGIMHDFKQWGFI